jgi:diguanylate cyclase (GGDEF)-like protein
LRAPATPIDETARLETLKNLDILNTPDEERFDRLTRMAKRVFGVPIALVTLVDENRQWFKSCVGLPVRETARDISFCGHAILGDEVFVIANALKDERFADNPLVLNDPGIRFYAGCPLYAPNGQKMGTLCVIDREPRQFNQEDIDTLKDLASMAERELAAVHMAARDELTDIPNRRAFMLLAQQSLHLCVRQRIGATLVFFDLDKFKPINDTYGHAEGDHALSAFAETMKRTYRSSDLFARLGGDEFVVLLTNTSRQDTEEIIARFDHAVEAHNRKANRGYRIQYSYGIVEFDAKKHRVVDDLLAEGDALMYLSKQERR